MPKNLEPTDILIDTKKNSFLKRENPFPHRRAFLFLIFVSLSFFIFSFKLFQLSAFSFEEFAQKAFKNQFILQQQFAERGIIFDRNGEPLVENSISFNLILDKTKFEKNPTSLEELEKILETSGLKEKLEKSEKNEILLWENLTQKQRFQIESNLEKFPFLKIQKVQARKYKEGNIFSPVLGYTRNENENLIGVFGIEGFYDELLKPVPGNIRIERNSLGKILKEEVESFPKPGKSLVLTVDARLQRKLFELLDSKIKELGAKGGAAVALNPKNGEVLALVSLPSFDNNVFFEQKEEVEKVLKGEGIFNRAIAGKYLVGSTIKPLIALAGLNEGKIKPEQTIECQGSLKIPHRYRPQIVYKFDDWTVHGIVDLKKAIAESCNVYFYLLGKNLGPSVIKNYLEKFNWGKLTQIDLMGEDSGFLPDAQWKKEKLNENWWDGDSMLYAIGQEYLGVTPLQAAIAFEAIAEEGVIFKPHLLKKVVDENKNVLEEKQPEILTKVEIPQEYFKIVKEGMRRAVTGLGAPHASAKMLADLPFSVAAKTGTAEIQKGVYNVWVTAFGPYEDPQILLTVVIEKVRGLSVVTLPIAKEFFNFWWQLQKQQN